MFSNRAQTLNIIESIKRDRLAKKMECSLVLVSFPKSLRRRKKLAVISVELDQDNGEHSLYRCHGLSGTNFSR